MERLMIKFLLELYLSHALGYTCLVNQCCGSKYIEFGSGPEFCTTLDPSPDLRVV